MLNKNNIKNVYTLSPMQEGMFFHSLHDSKTTAYLEQISYHLQGELDIKGVEKSLNQLMQRHDVLRTVFLHKKSDRLLQVVLKERDMEFYFEELSEETSQKEYLKEFKKKDLQRSFDLTTDVLMRVAVLQLGKSEYEFIWSYHHILMDGWCVGLLITEFLEMYRSYLENREYQLSPVTPYREYIQWLENQDKQKSLQYWEEYLKTYEEPAIIPGPAISHSGSRDYKLEEIVFYIDKDKVTGLNTMAGQYQVTLNTLVQSLWGIILGKYNRKEDVVFGATVSGRPTEVEGVESMVGLFINTIPVRVEFTGTLTFADLLIKVQEKALNAEPHHYFPLADIQAVSALKQNLLDHILVFENLPIVEQIDGAMNSSNPSKQATTPGQSPTPQPASDKKEMNFKMSNMEFYEQTHYNFNLIFSGMQQLCVRLNYNSSLYTGRFIRRIGQHIEMVMDQVLENPKIRVNQINLLAPKEKQRILKKFNQPAEEISAKKTIHQVFDEQVLKTPDRTALVFQQRKVSYRALERKTCQMSQKLVTNGIKNNTLVGIITDRSIDMMVGIIGILKAGGAYLPIDPKTPAYRRKYILADSSIKVLMGQEQYLGPQENGNPEYTLKEIPIGQKDEHLLRRDSAQNGVHPSFPGDLAYVIYTSGSSGKPKGVAVEHQSVVNLLNQLSQEYQFRGTDVFLLKTALVFDVSITELFGWSLKGAKLAILEKEAEKEPGKIMKALQYYQVSHINFVPSQFHTFIEAQATGIQNLTSLRYIMLAGEALALSTVEQFRKRNTRVQLANLYGPTEGTVYASTYILPNQEPERDISIGVPIKNNQLYILNPHHQLQPVGIPGELCISGAGVARGYQNNPELTEERFIQDPFTEGNILYKTGDLASWQEQGNIQYLGRMDHQVKIRGFRVELGEIENQLLGREEVQAAIVTAHTGEEPGDTFLCAYIQSEEEPDKEELKQYLSDTLPDYMVPQYVIPLKEIPLTPTGKINRRALPLPRNLRSLNFISPKNKMETRLVEIWSGVLGLPKERISLDSNFFDLGGHSLRATLVCARIQNQIKISIPLTILFENPTIIGLLEYIEKEPALRYGNMEPTEKKEYYCLSSAQKRMYVLQQVDKEGTSYNMPVMVPVSGDINKMEMENLFKKMIQRHENLRTSFQMIEEEPVQKVHDRVKFSITYHQREERGANTDLQVSNVLQEFVKAMDLHTPPLFRVEILELSENQYLLMMDIHHIIADGTTQEILRRDFVALFSNEDLAPLRIQYKDFATWQDHQYKTGRLKKQEGYWKKVLSGTIPKLELPRDFPRPHVFSFDGDVYRFTLDSETTQKFRELARQEGVTLYMNMLAAYCTLFYKYTGQTDMIVGSGVAGRPHPDLQGVIGMFINMLAMRNYPQGEKTFQEFLAEVRKNSIKAYENQDYQFEELVEKLDLHRDLSRNPLFDVTLVVQNYERNLTNQTNLDNPAKGGAKPRQEEISIGISDPKQEEMISSKTMEQGNKTSKFDLALFIIEDGENIRFFLEYYTKIFKLSTIQKISNHFLEIIQQVSENKYITLDEIKISHNISTLSSSIMNADQVEFDF
jgi:amino acid adenylation domain-containing protein